MFKKKDFNKLKDQGNIVFNSQFLKDLSAMERYEVLQLCHRRQYKAGEYIYYQDDPGTGMYFIEQGTVRLSVSDIPGDDVKNNFSIDISSPSEFGTMSIGYDINRLYSAHCITDCTLLGFFKPDFETLKKRHPETAVQFLEAISIKSMKQLEQTMKKLIQEIGAKPAFTILLESQYTSSE